MTFAMTWDSLNARLISVLQREEDPVLLDNLPMIIDFGERRIARELKTLGTREVVTSTFTPDNGRIQKPARWLETISINYGVGVGNDTRTFIFPRSSEFCKSYWPDLTQVDEPRYYADDNYNYWIIVPTPVAASPFEVSYYQRPVPLGPTSQTNWFTENAPDLLLYACLIETPGFLRADERLPMWQQAYDRHLQAFNNEAKTRVRDATTDRDGGI